MRSSVTRAATSLHSAAGRACVLAVILTAVVPAQAAKPAATKRDPQNLTILEPSYPRAFFFRASESPSGNPRITFEGWNASFSRLMGIEGKTLDEEVPGRSSRNIDFFTRFKKLHPDQLVLLHYNGNARDPRDGTGKFFAGHWLYYNGCKLLSDLPAEQGESDVRVEDPDLFQVGMGRYRTSNEDVGLCALDAAGRPDWNRSEQVQIVRIDRRNKTLRVRRGCYGTKPQAWTAGNTYAAAHVTEGPWGRRSNLLWFYNYSTRCPRDRQGRCCAEVLTDDLAARFLPGGELAAFDGLEFDVLSNEIHIHGPRREADCDADGHGDRGVFDGMNTYGIGVVRFCRLLRRSSATIASSWPTAWGPAASGPSASSTASRAKAGPC